MPLLKLKGADNGVNTIKVNLKKRSYNIIVGSNIINLLGKHIGRLDIGKDAYIITNAYIKNKYGGQLDKTLKQHGLGARFKLVPDSEKSKSIEMASLIIKDITRYDKKRRVFIVAFGGGVIGDLAGFIASVYKRGVAYIQVPTTLLAQVDSSIGGKTAVDLTEGKNLVGAFYQPRLVFSDIKILDTLNLRQIRSGLAEVIKYGIIKDPHLFIYLEKKYKDILALKTAALEFIIRRSSHIKAKIVEQDEREERAIRTSLNFGHTIGHAIEAASNYRGYSHGEAVSLGMLVASDISKELGFINDTTSKRIENLIRIVGLPIKIERIAINDIIKAYYHDKKFSGKKNRFVLIKGLGKTKIVENIPLKIIKEVLSNRI
jgi:3-dehydroquinate synthase